LGVPRQGIQLMTSPITDPVLQTCVVGVVVNAIGALTALYLWTQNRGERFLLFWMVSWAVNSIRWLVHYSAETDPVLREIEGLMIPAHLFFMMLGAYELLPTKPWKRTHVASIVFAIFFVYGAAAHIVRLPLEMGYALFCCALAFSGGCMWVSYLHSRLAGYAIAAAALAWQCAFVIIGLHFMGEDVSNHILGPLVYHELLTLSLIIIAYQRNRRQLSESEKMLQKIFETAPTPILITRPADGVIERANLRAFHMLGLTPESALGAPLAEHGVLADSGERQNIYKRLESGEDVTGREAVVRRSVGDERILSVNASRVALDSGPRHVFSFYDLTDLRRTEAALRSSSEELRKLYMRLGTIEEDERRIFHRELHDRIGANLSALRFELDLVRTFLGRNDATRADQHVGGALQVMHETMTLARDLMADLRPPALDEYGITAALRIFAETHSAPFNVPIEVAGNDLSPRLPTFVESAFFRIAHEALINAARHALATHVSISLYEREGHVTMSIEDDGRGFDEQVAMARQGHWGLKNMRERARAIGASLEIETAIGEGACLTVTWTREAP
jgi:PAS domain S-box-containing protein